MERVFKVQLEANLENLALARAAAAAYATELDPTVEELTEIKTAVSEAFSNAVIHGYRDSEGCSDMVEMEFGTLGEKTLVIKVRDTGVGIENIARAMEPLFTTDTGEERSGMGFTVMESFTDRIKVDSKPRKGTCVTMIKKLDTYYEI